MNIYKMVIDLSVKYEVKTGLTPSILYVGEAEFRDLMRFIYAQETVTDKNMKGHDGIKFCDLKVIRVFLNSHLNIC